LPTPVIPDEPDPTAAILYYNSIGFTDTATIIALIEENAQDLPPPVAVGRRNILSFTTINTVFAKINWPERFRALLSTVPR
jgi:hypothetical protein